MSLLFREDYSSWSLSLRVRPFFVAATLLIWLTSVTRAQTALINLDQSVNHQVRAVAWQTDGKILIGGTFTNLSSNHSSSVTRHGIARLNPDGTLDMAFNPNASAPPAVSNGAVQSITVRPDGKILIAGGFTTLAPNGGPPVTCNRIAVLNHDGTLDPAFRGNANGTIRVITTQPDGKILIGGDFTTFSLTGEAPITRLYLARLNKDLSLDKAFQVRPDDIVQSIALQKDGKILIGGQFATIQANGGAPVNHDRLARLNPDGTLDTTFHTDTNGNILTMTVQPDGRILIGGEFTTVSPNRAAPVNRNRIARLNSDGTLDPIFDPNANDKVQVISLHTSGKILVIGLFSTLTPNNSFRARFNSIARLNMDGTIDPFSSF